jgi:hypothetical protein
MPRVVAGLALLSVIGCKSTDSSEKPPFASVIIAGNTPGQIRNVAVDVFTDQGFKVRQSNPAGMVFEKQGSRMNDIAYGSWMGDTPVWVRVKADTVPAGEMKLRLECTAWLVIDIGSAAEEEKSISRLHRGTYQKLLNEVAKRLRQGNP